MSSFREKSALLFSLYKYLIVIIGFPLEVLAVRKHVYVIYRCFSSCKKWKFFVEKF